MRGVKAKLEAEDMQGALAILSGIKANGATKRQSEQPSETANNSRLAELQRNYEAALAAARTQQVQHEQEMAERERAIKEL